MELFEIDDLTKLAVPTAQARTIASLKEILTRPRPIDGDRDGKKKTLNMLELAYIGFAGKYDSRWKLTSGKERDDSIKKLVGLPNNWEPDPLVLQGLADYVENQITESTPLVEVLSESIINLTKYIKRANTQLADAGLDSSQEIDKYLNILDRIPTSVEGLRQAKEKLNREQDVLAKGKKGRIVNKFELQD